jgi:hypothetical protein
VNLEQHQNGMLECLGQMRTWVSGTSSASSAIVGSWSDVLRLESDDCRIDLVSRNERLDLS